MNRKLLRTILATAIVTSILTGCGDKAETGEADTVAVMATAGADAEKEMEMETQDAAQTTETSKEVPTAGETQTATPEETGNSETTKTETMDSETMKPKTATAGETGYTYIEMSQTMYAKSGVNVRDLPGTSGNSLGSLTANEEVQVTGQCNESGWYRIVYNGSEAFVSGSYLVAEKPEAVTAEKDAETAKVPVASEAKETDTSGETVNPAPAHEVIYVDAGVIALDTSLLDYVNEDRANNGAGALVWSDSLAQYCIDRIPVVNYNHENDLDPHTGWTKWENLTMGAVFTTKQANQNWINSAGHHENRINSSWTSYAAASYEDPDTGLIIWIEAFE